MISKRLIIFCLAVFSLLSLRAQTGESPDSLLTVVESMPHDSLRMRKLLEITNQLYTSDTERCIKFNELLIEQASQQQNAEYYLCQAYFTKIVMAINSYDQQTVEQTFELMSPIARKAKLYDDLFRAWRCVIDIKILSQDFEHSESAAQQMLREAEKLNNKVGVVEAYQSLASIYRVTFRKQEALELLEKALPQAQAIGREGTIFNILQTMIFLYQERGGANNPAKWHQTLETFENFLEATSGTTPDPTFLILYGSYINYYIHQEQLDRAGRLIEWVDVQYYPHITSPLYRIYYDIACSQYFEQIDELEKALERADAALSYIQKITTGEDYHNQLLQKARLLNRLGRWSEALPLYKQTLIYNDSLQVETINKQYEQLKQSFNAGQLELEQAQLRHRTQVVTLILLGLGLLVVLYFIVYLLHNRNALRKAEAQMRQMADKMEQVNEAKDRFLSNISATIRTPLNTVVDGSLRLAMQQVEDHTERQVLSSDIRLMSAGLLKMINDILDLSRLEAGMMKFDPTEIELSSQILDSAMSAKKPADIRIEYPQDTLYMVKFDALRLQQLLSSLFEEQDKPDKQIVAIISEQEPYLILSVSGTLLARENPTQEIIIRNEINRMLVTHFEGQYVIRKQGGGELVVLLSLPVQPLKP